LKADQPRSRQCLHDHQQYRLPRSDGSFLICHATFERFEQWFSLAPCHKAQQLKQAPLKQK
ncbi:hypothetical protein D043_2710B, partial [Vibrio parahaemolyticus EKP-021]